MSERHPPEMPASALVARVARVYPMYLVALGVTGLLLAVSHPTATREQIAVSGVASAHQERAHESGVVVMAGETVAVIGAGPAGLTAAYELSKADRTVTVFEAGQEVGGLGGLFGLSVSRRSPGRAEK